MATHTALAERSDHILEQDGEGQGSGPQQPARNYFNKDRNSMAERNNERGQFADQVAKAGLTATPDPIVRETD